MTAVADAARAAAPDATTGETLSPVYAVEKPRMPLVWKLFGLTALLIVVVVGLAVAITIQRATSVARQTVDKSISSAARLFEDLERRRLNALALPVQLLGNDGNFVAYINENYGAHTDAPPAAQGQLPAAPAPATDFPSLNDQLEQRRASFGTDVLILLDDQGRVITRTDQPSITAPSGDDLYELSPVVRSIVDNPSAGAAAGVVALGQKLYHAAVAPVAAGPQPVPVAFLLSGSAIDENFANSIARSTNADVMFMAAGNNGPVVRSSGAPSFGTQQMHGVDQIIGSGKRMPPETQEIGGGSYVVTGQPLVAGKQIAGAAVFLRSVDREMAPFREIERSLLGGGGAALLLAFVLSWFIAKRMTGPIAQLAQMAQAVTAGDYSVHPAVGSTDEVGILGRSFAKMISSLRDKAELEQLYNEMAARSAEREVLPRAAAEPARLEEGTVLVTDLRGLPVAVGDGDAPQVISSITRLMKIQEGEVIRQEGEVREVAGHRLVSVFRGERGMIHAIRAARAINEEIAMQGGVPGVVIGAGISTGEFVTGSVELSRESGPATVGNAPLLALLFAWHAPGGHAFIAYDTAQAAGADIVSATTREEVRLKWLSQPLAVASLPLVSATTGVIRTGTISTMETMKLTGAGPTASPPGAPVADLQSGALFANRYRIEQIIGRGGMGVVYRANDTQLDEAVAIKTLPGDVMQRSPEDLERFKREIRLARKITHRNVLRTFDYGEAEGVYFISMEFVRGYTLAELMSEAAGRQIAPRVAMGISRQICRGLHAAHEQGIIHRDIKPQNVLIDAKGEVKLMDFGIARMAEAPQAMTQAGLIVGTPHYMSPEQVKGEQLDARSDVYAMGVLMYEMLVGKRPFESSSLTGVLAAHVTEQPKPPIDARPAIGERVNAIVMRCLAKDPKARYADAGALLADLDAVQLSSSAAA